MVSSSVTRNYKVLIQHTQSVNSQDWKQEVCWRYTSKFGCNCAVGLVDDDLQLTLLLLDESMLRYECRKTCAGAMMLFKYAYILASICTGAVMLPTYACSPSRLCVGL